MFFKEIKDFCECNIEAGSIHFHTLLAVIGEGISRHIDYLGGSTLALGYTLLPNPKQSAKDGNWDVGDSKLLAIIANAPAERPVASDYTSQSAFLRDKLAYIVASRKKLRDEGTGETFTINGKGVEL